MPAPEQQRLEVMARDALRAHGLDAGVTLTLLTISENATFAVDDAVTGQRSMLRLHRPGYQDARAIESELAWIRALRAEDVVRTPEVLPARDGGFVGRGRHPDGEQRYAVRFDWVAGTEPAGTPADFRSLGAVTARLHQHARRWPLSSGFDRLRWDAAGILGPGGHWGRWQDGLGIGRAERQILGDLDAALRRRLGAFGTGADRFGLVHADLRLANLLVSGPGTTGPGTTGTGTVHVIDFDDCGFSWFMYDLGAALSFIEHEPRVPELIDAWTAGYREVAPLGAAEEAELMTFVLLRRLLLVAWIGSHADTDLARSMGEGFTRASCDLADSYLTRR